MKTRTVHLVTNKKSRRIRASPRVKRKRMKRRVELMRTRWIIWRGFPLWETRVLTRYPVAWIKLVQEKT